MTEQMAKWNMPATIVRWKDGDTCVVTAETQPNNVATVVVRIYGIDCPEEGEPGHDEAAALANEIAPPGAAVVLGVCPLPDKYGRWLASVYNNANLQDVGKTMLDRHLAVPYFGGSKEKWQALAEKRTA